MTKIQILHDDQTCISCGACVTICPEKWEFKETNGELKVVNHDKELVEKETTLANKAKEAVAACPVTAIGLKDIE